MRTTEAKNIIKKFGYKLRESKYPFRSLYLFGSFAKKNNDRWSDIDVAVISDNLRNYRGKNQALLWILGYTVDDRIEPHGFTRKEFNDLNDPMVYEIRTTGIRVV